jgi:RNA polymerase subunit RPABC4/transcription elongation factor Spt4
LGELNQCKNCKSIINSGEYDWVLSEITQIEEWKPDNKNDVNLKEYAKVTDIDSFHKAKVLVLWSGASSPSSEPVHQRHILHLSIRVGTEKKSGLSENSCETCGAPLPESDSLTCEYCGDSVPKTVADWLLDRIEVLNHY